MARAPVDRSLKPGSPLWQRVPSRDCVDFMLLIPNIGRYSAAGREGQYMKLRDSLAPFEQSLLCVDFNQKLGVIWISLRPAPGITRVVLAAVQRQLPEALLVASQCHPDPAAPTPHRPRLALARPWKGKLWRRLLRLG